MKVQRYFTKIELLRAWLKVWPFDVARSYEDVEFDALAGYVETANGFIYYSEYTHRGT